MTSPFRKTIEARAKLPPRVVDLPLSAWADTYEDKPSDVMRVGLRLISEAEAATCRAEAAKKAWEYHEGDEDEDARIEAYNGFLMVLALARGTCQPDDGTAPMWDMAEDKIPIALSPGGIEYLYGELDTLTLAESPTMPEVSDEEIAHLAASLADGSAWRGVSGADAHRVKRLLHVCLELLTVAEIEN